VTLTVTKLSRTATEKRPSRGALEAREGPLSGCALVQPNDLSGLRAGEVLIEASGILRVLTRVPVAAGDRVIRVPMYTSARVSETPAASRKVEKLWRHSWSVIRLSFAAFQAV
jgi:hypothetical protein